MSQSQVSPVPIDQFRSALLALYRPPMRAKATHAKMRGALDGLLATGLVRTTADLTTQSIAGWLAGRGEANPNTTISLLIALRAGCNYAVEEGWLERGPAWKRLWVRRAPSSRWAGVSQADVGRLLDSLSSRRAGWKDRRLYGLTSLVAYTGVRLGEALHARVDDLDLVRGVFTVSARRRLKTEGSARIVPLPAECRPILAAWLSEAGPVWLFPGARRTSPRVGGAPGYRPTDRLKAAAGEVGIAGLTFHGLRHTLAKLLVGEFGKSRDQARTLLGHGDVRTTEEHYLHRDDLAIRQKIGEGVTYPRSA